MVKKSYLLIPLFLLSACVSQTSEEPIKIDESTKKSMEKLEQEEQRAMNFSVPENRNMNVSIDQETSNGNRNNNANNNATGNTFTGSLSTEPHQ